MSKKGISALVNDLIVRLSKCQTRDEAIDVLLHVEHRYDLLDLGREIGAPVYNSDSKNTVIDKIVAAKIQGNVLPAFANESNFEDKLSFYGLDPEPKVRADVPAPRAESLTTVPCGACNERCDTWQQCPDRSCKMNVAFCNDHGGLLRAQEDMRNHIVIKHERSGNGR